MGNVIPLAAPDVDALAEELLPLLVATGEACCFANVADRAMWRRAVRRAGRQVGSRVAVVEGAAGLRAVIVSTPSPVLSPKSDDPEGGATISNLRPLNPSGR